MFSSPNNGLRIVHLLCNLCENAPQGDDIHNITAECHFMDYSVLAVKAAQLWQFR